MLKTLKNFLNLLSEFLYTNKCIVCNKNAEDFICKNCAKEINTLSSYPIKIYKNVPVYCACLYETSVKKLIKSLKFYGKKRASIPLAKILFQYFLKLELKKNFIVIYPPAFFSKNIRRGYCHMDLLAEEFSKSANLKTEKKLIKKIKYTKPQYVSKNREKNIKGSFAVNNKLVEKYKNSPVLLIDDIITSGATVNTIIDILIKAGFCDITCLIIAKAGGKNDFGQ